MVLNKYLAHTGISKAFKILHQEERLKYVAVTLAQTFLGLLDLVGVAVVGAIGSLAVSGIQSKDPGNRVTEVLEFMNLQNLTLQLQIAVLGTIAVILFVSKTLLAMYLTRKILFFLSLRSARISAESFSRLLGTSVSKIAERTNQENLYALTSGVNAITLGILGSVSTIVSDFTLLLILLTGLFVLDISIAFSTLFLFGTIAILLYTYLQKRAKALGQLEFNLTISGNEKIVEVLTNFREAFVRNQQANYADEVRQIRERLSSTLAEVAFLPNISKYIVEASVVIGALLIAASQFMMQDAGNAVATLAVFLAAGSRIAPAVLRIQQGAIQIRNSVSIARTSFDLISELDQIASPNRDLVKIQFTHPGLRGGFEVRDLSFKFKNSNSYVLSNLSFEISPGSTVAIVGPSGSGKSTLVDVLLGILEPDQGEVLLDGMKPAFQISRNPGSIAYVPQGALIIDGSLRDNLLLGLDTQQISEEMILKSLERAHLRNFVSQLPNGLETQAGEAGTKISGGQRQRLGIARSLMTNPKVLVLDEATSALDGETERGITESIQGLRGEVTVIQIAHRLSTIRDADLVLFLDGGRLLAQGSFEQVRRQIPNFDSQARLMGL
jgi:ABC-type multidrug transport system fused ATPase/permease subunit